MVRACLEKALKISRLQKRTKRKLTSADLKSTFDQSHQLQNHKTGISGAIVFCRILNAVVLALLTIAFFLCPAFLVIWDLKDPQIRSVGIPVAAWKLHRALSPKYARWARQRIATDRGLELSTSNISGTEWPLFGSVFYLWATETLQDEWTKSKFTTIAPNVYAHEAIEAATDLVIDPNQAGWVKKHWGDDYLKRENAFYRMLVIAALTSHARLTGDSRHLDFLLEQVESEDKP